MYKNISENIKVGYLGDGKSHHCQTLSLLFKGFNIPILDNTNIDNSSEYKLYEKMDLIKKGSTLQKIFRIYYKLFGTKKPNYRAVLAKYFKDQKVNTLLAYWGTNPISDIISIKRFHPDVKIILNISFSYFCVNYTMGSIYISHNITFFILKILLF